MGYKYCLDGISNLRLSLQKFLAALTLQDGSSLLGLTCFCLLTMETVFGYKLF